MNRREQAKVESLVPNSGLNSGVVVAASASMPSAGPSLAIAATPSVTSPLVAPVTVGETGNGSAIAIEKPSGERRIVVPPKTAPSEASVKASPNPPTATANAKPHDKGEIL